MSGVYYFTGRSVVTLLCLLDFDVHRLVNSEEENLTFSMDCFTVHAGPQGQPYQHNAAQ